ncbi:MAG: sulfotransferase [Phycisphaeraceae bacterium]
MTSTTPEKPEHRLIFLVSQPRAGSTLLQRMLGTHPDIATVGEPWLALHALLPIRPDLWDARFKTATFTRAFDALPEGRLAYIETARHGLMARYNAWCDQQNASVFMDKTPRYYLVLKELRELFPEARIILLIRNPLAVLCSIVNTWVGDRWYHLYDSADDLLAAPNLLAEAIQTPGVVDQILHYESLVASPQETLRKLLANLDIPWDDSVLNYARSGSLPWALGDPTNAHQKLSPDAAHADRWSYSLSDAQLWRCARDYLDELSDHTLATLGYRRDQLRIPIEAHRPNWSQRITTTSLSDLLARDPAIRSSWARHNLTLLNRVRELGWLGTIADAGHRISRKTRRRLTSPIRLAGNIAASPAPPNPMTPSGDPPPVGSDPEHEPQHHGTQDHDPHGRRRIPRTVPRHRLHGSSKPAA